MNATTAFIVRVPEAEPLVRSLRDRFDPSAALGVPAHITILFPFMPPERVTPDVLRDAANALAGASAFSYVLNEVRRWPETVYLAPEPAQPFTELIRAVAGRFPDYPPYEGAHADVVPHLTVADRTGDGAAVAEGELRAALGRGGGIRAECREIELIENSTGLWKTMHVIPLPA